MRRKLIVIAILALGAFSFASCTKRCRCVQYNGSIVYFSKEDVEAKNKHCYEMQYLDGMHTQYYSYCEWTHGD